MVSDVKFQPFGGRTEQCEVTVTNMVSDDGINETVAFDSCKTVTNFRTSLLMGEHIKQGTKSYETSMDIARQAVMRYNSEGSDPYQYQLESLQNAAQYMHCAVSSLIKPGSSNHEVNTTGCWRRVTSGFAVRERFKRPLPNERMESQQEEVLETASPTYPDLAEDSEELDTDYQSRDLEVKSHQWGVKRLKRKLQLLKRIIRKLNEKCTPFVEKLYLSGVPNLLIEHQRLWEFRIKLRDIVREFNSMLNDSFYHRLFRIERSPAKATAVFKQMLTDATSIYKWESDEGMLYRHQLADHIIRANFVRCKAKFTESDEEQLKEISDCEYVYFGDYKPRRPMLGRELASEHFQELIDKAVSLFNNGIDSAHWHKLLTIEDPTIEYMVSCRVRYWQRAWITFHETTDVHDCELIPMKTTFFSNGKRMRVDRKLSQKSNIQCANSRKERLRKLFDDQMDLGQQYEMMAVDQVEESPVPGKRLTFTLYFKPKTTGQKCARIDQRTCPPDMAAKNSGRGNTMKRKATTETGSQLTGGKQPLTSEDFKSDRFSELVQQANHQCNLAGNQENWYKQEAVLGGTKQTLTVCSVKLWHRPWINSTEITVRDIWFVDANDGGISETVRLVNETNRGLERALMEDAVRNFNTHDGKPHIYKLSSATEKTRKHKGEEIKTLEVTLRETACPNVIDQSESFKKNSCYNNLTKELASAKVGIIKMKNFARSDIRVLSADEINSTPFQELLKRVIVKYNDAKETPCTKSQAITSDMKCADLTETLSGGRTEQCQVTVTSSLSDDGANETIAFDHCKSVARFMGYLLGGRQHVKPGTLSHKTCLVIAEQAVGRYNSQSNDLRKYRLEDVQNVASKEYLHCAVSAHKKPTAPEHEINITNCWRHAILTLGTNWTYAYLSPEELLQLQGGDAVKSVMETYHVLNKQMEGSEIDYLSDGLKITKYKCDVIVIRQEGQPEKRRLSTCIEKPPSSKLTPLGGPKEISAEQQRRPEFRLKVRNAVRRYNNMANNLYYHRLLRVENPVTQHSTVCSVKLWSKPWENFTKIDFQDCQILAMEIPIVVQSISDDIQATDEFKELVSYVALMFNLKSNEKMLYQSHLVDDVVRANFARCRVKIVEFDKGATVQLSNCEYVYFGEHSLPRPLHGWEQATALFHEVVDRAVNVFNARVDSHYWYKLFAIEDPTIEYMVSCHVRYWQRSWVTFHETLDVSDCELVPITRKNSSNEYQTMADRKQSQESNLQCISSQNKRWLKLFTDQVTLGQPYGLMAVEELEESPVPGKRFTFEMYFKPESTAKECSGSNQGGCSTYKHFYVCKGIYWWKNWKNEETLEISQCKNITRFKTPATTTEVDSAPDDMELKEMVTKAVELYNEKLADFYIFGEDNVQNVMHKNRVECSVTVLQRPWLGGTEHIWLQNCHDSYSYPSSAGIHQISEEEENSDAFKDAVKRLGEMYTTDEPIIYTVKHENATAQQNATQRLIRLVLILEPVGCDYTKPNSNTPACRDWKNQDKVKCFAEIIQELGGISHRVLKLTGCSPIIEPMAERLLKPSEYETTSFKRALRKAWELFHQIMRRSGQLFNIVDVKDGTIEVLRNCGVKVTTNEEGEHVAVSCTSY
ncbi:putative cys1 protein [Clonorchis sinensis]|uniref:Putative cys1 protein n=1 Tax=Clonorchis sinensis TaxID=79923 RepID=G7YFI6_CLOSI|nr:putative cys1 protein [Clonorchis sinensis]